MIDLRLHRMVDRAGKSPEPWVYGEEFIHRTRPQSVDRLRRYWTIWARCGANKIERIEQLSSALWSLLANVVGIIDRQMRAVAANVADLSDCVGTELFLEGQVPQL